jgi:hypothetical protein
MSHTPKEIIFMSNRVRSLEKARHRKEHVEGIKVTLNQLLDSTSVNPVMLGPLDMLSRQPIPIVTSFELLKVARAAAQEVEQYEAARKVLCERYTNKDAEGKAIMLDEDNKPVSEGQPGHHYDIPTDKIADFNNELIELRATEVTIPGKQIKVSDLLGVKIAPTHLLALEWLLVE